jgi:hypothetical protein
MNRQLSGVDWARGAEARTALAFPFPRAQVAGEPAGSAYSLLFRSNSFRFGLLQEGSSRKRLAGSGLREVVLEEASGKKGARRQVPPRETRSRGHGCAGILLRIRLVVGARYT